MEYVSRIHVKVNDASVWERLYDLDLSPYGFAVPANVLFNLTSTDFVIDGDWGTTPNELEEFVSDIAGAVEEDGVIIADNTCVDAAPYTFVVTYFGDEIGSCYYTFNGNRSNDKRCELFEKAKINDIGSYIRCAHQLYENGLDLSIVEEEYLLQFGVSV